MRRAVVIAVVMLGCGGGGTPPAGLGTDECAQDAECEDGISCTRDACVASVGGVRKCQHEPRDELCGPRERCMVGAAGGVAGCQAEEVVACLGLGEGAACEVSDPCRMGPGTCRGGRCEYSTKSCPEQACQRSLGCDQGTGDCRYEALADGSECVFPADPCRPARCNSGECKPTGAALCDDQNPCTQDICSINICEHRDQPDKTPCDDANPCTVGESCTDGVCGGGKVRDCDDGNDCTEDSCEPALGCVSRALADGEPCFAGGNRCRPGTCEAGACTGARDLDCDDHDPCTQDSCDPTHGCRHAPLSDVPCDDGNACTKDDRCAAGVCGPGKTVTCNDQNPCTTDACDPTKGCVFDTIAPCCGNRMVEGAEQCDAGPGGSDGCGPDCRFRVVTLAEPPSGGRFGSVAWSGSLDSGLVAYEAAPVNRVVVARRVGPDLAVGPEALVLNYKASGIEDLAVIATPGGPGDFLLAVSRPVAVDLFALDRDGVAVVSRLEVWGMENPAVTPGRIRLGLIGPGRSVVAWQDGIYCAGSQFAPVVRVGEMDFDTGGASEPVLFGSSTCDPWTPAVLGDACGVEGAGVFTLSQRVTDGHVKMIRHLVLPYDAKGLKNPWTLAEYPGDAAFPPICALSANGQAFLFFYWEIDAVAGVVRVRARVTGLNGGPLGGPWTLQEVSGQDPNPTLCMTPVSAAVGLADGRFLVLCAMMKFDAGANISGSAFSMRVLGADGQPSGDFSPLGQEGEVVAYGASMARGPSGDVLAAWYETDAFKTLGEWETTPGWLRLFTLGEDSVH